MSTANLKKSKLSQEVNKAINEGFSFNTLSDTDLLKQSNYSWDDLTNLKTELGNSVLEFVSQVTGVISQKEIIDNLKENLNSFNNVVKVFFSDINEFSDKVKHLRLQHEGRTGPIVDLDEYNLYNRLAISYHSLYSELNMLITPTLGELMVLVTESVNNQQAKEKEITEVKE